MNMADKKILDAVDTELLRFTTAGRGRGPGSRGLERWLLDG